MSILKSTRSGRLRIISDYLENKYSKMRLWDGSPKVEYDIIECKNDYIIRLKPQIKTTIIYVNGKEFPCKMVFDNKPYVLFSYFTTPDKFELIDKHFYINCFNYEFRCCSIYPEQQKFLVHNYKHFHQSDIYVDEKFFTEILPKHNIEYSDFINSLKEQNNTLFVRKYHEIYRFDETHSSYTYEKIDV